ncbi:MAG: cytochrome c [Thiotrichaceae bacterium]|nr:cytochrome c [Thiotrichaceae bacterium]
MSLEANIKKLNTIAFCLLISLLLTAACYAEQTQDNLGMQVVPAIQMPDDERKKELAYIVLQDCGSCHGMTLKGGLGPSLRVQRLAVLPKQYLIDAVTHGRKDTPMPPWEPLLTQGEILWIVEQLQLGLLGKPE